MVDDSSEEIDFDVSAPVPAIGIDLGMTSAVAAYVRTPGEAPAIIPAEKRQATVAAVVAYPENAAPVVGRPARDMLITDPSRAVTGIKRLLGRKSDSQAIRDLRARVGYEIGETEAGDVVVEIDNRQIRPEEVAGALLQRVKEFAETELSDTVKKCVIAVPAYFNSKQKEAVREAALIAGLEPIKLVHEPTAVALAYGYNKVGDARVLIVDMGGVRLDVSLMEITGNVFDVVATSGDAYLGGANLDARVTDWILEKVEGETGKDLGAHPELLIKVRTAAEQSKKELSKYQAVELHIPTDVDDKKQVTQIRLDRETLESLAEDLTDRVLHLIDRVLGQKKLKPEEVDDVILVGGGTRLPLLKSRVAKHFDREPQDKLPTQDVIALGAALLAESLERSDQNETGTLLEAPVGIALADGRFMRIIEKNSKLPISRRIMIPTTRDNQRVIEVDLFQGDTEELIDADYLGTVAYPGIEEAAAGEAKLIIDLALGDNLVLELSCPEAHRPNTKFSFMTAGHAERPPDTEPQARFVVVEPDSGA